MHRNASRAVTQREVVVAAVSSGGVALRCRRRGSKSMEAVDAYGE